MLLNFPNILLVRFLFANRPILSLPGLVFSPCSETELARECACPSEGKRMRFSFPGVEGELVVEGASDGVCLCLPFGVAVTSLGGVVGAVIVAPFMGGVDGTGLPLVMGAGSSLGGEEEVPFIGGSGWCVDGSSAIAAAVAATSLATSVSGDFDTTTSVLGGAISAAAPRNVMGTGTIGATAEFSSGVGGIDVVGSATGVGSGAGVVTGSDSTIAEVCTTAAAGNGSSAGVFAGVCVK